MPLQKLLFETLIPIGALVSSVTLIVTIVLH